jgi:hypothetical protein
MGWNFQVMYAFHYKNFHETHKCSMELCGHRLYQISSESVEKYIKYGQRSRHGFTWFYEKHNHWMTATGNRLYRISPKSVRRYTNYGAEINLHSRVKYDCQCAEFHENSYHTNFGAEFLNQISWKSEKWFSRFRRTWSPHKPFLYLTS